ncbi:MAG: hypothetical protein Q3962_06470 [Corynebacterium sp.]|nr:hypothetical protein [Corynebacterium sp.]
MEETQDKAPRDRGQMILVIFVMLAIIASVVMLLTNGEVYLKIAVVVSLWAALLGLFVSVQMRRDRDIARGINAAQTAELELAYSRQDIEDYQLRTLEELKSELSELRAHIQNITGQDFSYEPPAVRADARRIQELTPNTPAGPKNSGPVDPVSGEGPASLDEAVAANRTAEKNTQGSEEKDTEKTAVHPRVQAPRQNVDPDLEARRKAADARREQARERARQAEAARAQRKADKQLSSERDQSKNDNNPAQSAQRGQGFQTGSFRRVDWMTGEHTGITEVLKDAPEQAGHHEAKSTTNDATAAQPDSQADSAGGRRRRENNEGALGLEELLRNLKRD